MKIEEQLCILFNDWNHFESLFDIFNIDLKTKTVVFRNKTSLTLSVPNFRRHLSYVFFFFFFFFLTNCPLERDSYVKLKDRMSNSVDPDETAHYEPSHLDLCYLQNPILIACGSERIKHNADNSLLNTLSLLFSEPLSEKLNFRKSVSSKD